MNSVEWSQLRGALIFLLIATAVSGGLWWWSIDFKAQTMALKDRNQAILSTATEEKQATEQAIKTLNEDYEAYQQLERRGFIVSGGQDLEWFDYLDTLQRGTKLPRFMAFEITPSIDYTLPDINEAEDFQVVRSTISFNFELLHTGDLFMLLDDLDKQRLPGIYQVTRCDMERLTQSTSSRADQANLSGNCELQWYRVKISNSGNY